MEAVIFVGIQAAGKSTFYRERFFDTHIHINLDMLRTRHRERILVRACVNAKQPFVVDNTNILAAERARYIALAKPAGFRIVGYYFQTDLQAALKRNSLRTGRKMIPAKGVVGTYKRLQSPRVEEGFDLLFCVSIDVANRFVVQEWSL
jgi:predicted kinase